MDMLHDLSLFEPETLRAYWNSTCSSADQQTVMKEFFKAPKFYVDHGGEGMYMGTVSAEHRQCLLVSEAKALRLADILADCIGVNPLLAKGLPVAHKTFTDVESALIDSEATLYKLQKVIKKYKKDAKRHVELAQARGGSSKARDLAFSPEEFVVFICIDIEWHERNQDTTLELGWSLWNSRKQQHWSKHWIVEENLRVVNGTFVANRKHAFGAKFGTSQTGPLAEGLLLLQKDLLYGGYPGPFPPAGRVSAAGGRGRPQLVLVGHNLKHDREQLESLDVTIPDDMEMFDTIDLNWARLGGDRGQGQVSLQNLCHEMGITPSCLHNAGNDARFTMECFLALLKKPLLAPGAASSARFVDEEYEEVEAAVS